MSKRLRAGSGEDPGDDGDLVDDDAARATAARASAAAWSQVVVLKGARTVVAGPDAARPIQLQPGGRHLGLDANSQRGRVHGSHELILGGRARHLLDLSQDEPHVHWQQPCEERHH